MTRRTATASSGFPDGRFTRGGSWRFCGLSSGNFDSQKHMLVGTNWEDQLMRTYDWVGRLEPLPGKHQSNLLEIYKDAKIDESIKNTLGGIAFHQVCNACRRRELMSHLTGESEKGGKSENKSTEILATKSTELISAEKSTKITTNSQTQMEVSTAPNEFSNDIQKPTTNTRKLTTNDSFCTADNKSGKIRITYEVCGCSTDFLNGMYASKNSLFENKAFVTELNSEVAKTNINLTNTFATSSSITSLHIDGPVPGCGATKSIAKSALSLAPSCTITEHTCGNGECIELYSENPITNEIRHVLCDGITQCSDKTDEYNCPCSENQKKCPKTLQCIPSYEWCPECCEAAFFSDTACKDYKMLKDCEIDVIAELFSDMKDENGNTPCLTGKNWCECLKLAQSSLSEEELKKLQCDFFSIDPFNVDPGSPTFSLLAERCAREAAVKAAKVNENKIGQADEVDVEAGNNENQNNNNENQDSDDEIKPDKEIRCDAAKSVLRQMFSKAQECLTIFDTGSGEYCGCEEEFTLFFEKSEKKALVCTLFSLIILMILS